MLIRNYQPGDEQAQADIYNEAAGGFPAFKAATAEEIARRYRGHEGDTGSRFVAVQGNRVVGYAVFCPSGRVSYPWTLPFAADAREPLFDAVIAEMVRRGMPEAWAAYRADWSPVLDFFKAHGFEEKRQMINYLADIARMPEARDLPEGRIIEPLGRHEMADLAAMSPRLFGAIEPHSLEAFFWENPHYNFSESLFALKEARTGRLLGASLLVMSDQFADPSQVDAAMPCFRLGSFGTERERHKRINGMFSCTFLDEADAAPLLSAPDWARARASGLTHVAAQAPTDAPALCAFYDGYFQRQGAFPIVTRLLAV